MKAPSSLLACSLLPSSEVAQALWKTGAQASAIDHGFVDSVFLAGMSVFLVKCKVRDASED